MSIGLKPSDKYNLAKSFTELAIQNNLFTHYQNPSDTAKQISTFFDTIVENIDSNVSDDAQSK